MKSPATKTLFLDIGGVLLTDGWNRHARQLAIEQFKLNPNETADRHQLCFDTYELGKTSFDDYLDHVIFYQPRTFSKADFIAFMYAQSRPLNGALEFFKAVKAKYGLKVIALSNEPRDLNDYRIKEFKLNTLFDAYISSCYVKLRKPDPDIYHLACDVSQAPLDQILYIDDRLMYIDVAKGFKIPSLQHTNLETTKKYFETIGLSMK